MTSQLALESFWQVLLRNFFENKGEIILCTVNRLILSHGFTLVSLSVGLLELRIYRAVLICHSFNSFNKLKFMIS